MKRVAFYTLGCKVNQYETEAISEIFENSGYELVEFEDKADVYVINTCTVTSMSDRKSRQVIRKAKKTNPDSIVIVVGCYAQTSPDEVKNIKGVNIVVGTKDKGSILKYLEEYEKDKIGIEYVEDIMKVREFERLEVKSYKDRTRAFLKIQDGCNQYCSYCIIPYARGNIRSKAPEEVLAEVQSLAERGFKEVVLTGIHLASYGKDLKTVTLLDVIKEINKISGIHRIRLGSIEPLLLSEEFVQEIKDIEKLCPHFHISLQSGCDLTLKRMNRKYDAAFYKNVVERLRANISDVAITTDIMVGFPGETNEEFESTFKFLKDIKLAKTHVFKYSPRKGTPAASFEKQVSAEVKEERSNRLIELSDENAKLFNSKFLNREMPVLFEQKMDDGFTEGHTTNYIRVLCKDNDRLKGNICNVEIMDIKDDYLIGSIK